MGESRGPVGREFLVLARLIDHFERAALGEQTRHGHAGTAYLHPYGG